MAQFFDLFSDPEEGPFLTALMKDSSDLEARAGYAELLERRGDPRADVLKLANRLLAGIADDEERRAAAARIAEIDVEELDYWTRLIARPLRLQNCGQASRQPRRVRFAFACPQTWGGLRPTDDPDIRFCESCSSQVVRCRTLTEAESQARLGACIAVDGRLMGEASDRYCRMMVGRPDVVARWADSLFVDE